MTVRNMLRPYVIDDAHNAHEETLVSKWWMLWIIMWMGCVNNVNVIVFGAYVPVPAHVVHPTCSMLEMTNLTP